jgi:anti-anti-sigma factor
MPARQGGVGHPCHQGGSGVVTGFSDDGARLHMAVHTDGDRTTLTLTGELDRFSGQPLVPLLDAAMDGSVKHLEVHMARVGFVDVDGVRVLVHAYHLGASRGINLTLHDPQPDIVWLLHITGAAVLLGESTAPADAAMPDLVWPKPPVNQ